MHTDKSAPVTLNGLAEELKHMYLTAPRGQRTTMIHLFGIRFASTIRNSGFSPSEILAAAGLSGTYVTEINKGIRLAAYVTVRDGVI